MSSGIYIRTKKTRESLRKSHIGKAGFWKGKKRPFFSEKHRKKMSDAQIKRVKEGRNHLWKGGINKLKIYKHYGNAEYREWRNKVFERDNWTCKFCGARCGKDNPIFIVPHHIKGYTHYPDLRYKINNGITLCRACHLLTIGKEIQFEQICLFKLLGTE